jgi:hypothetical protein
MITNTSLKIFLTIVLFTVGAYYINFAISNGYIKASIKASEVAADADTTK